MTITPLILLLFFEMCVSGFFVLFFIVEILKEVKPIKTTQNIQTVKSSLLLINTLAFILSLINLIRELYR